MLAGTTQLCDLIDPHRSTAIVDIGANPVDGDPPYAEMLRAGLCTVIGFEPQPEALAELERKKGSLERYLPYVIADGFPHTLKVTAASGMTSLLEPDPARLEMFNGFRDWGQVVARHSVQTNRLDDLAELENMDMLKIDVQGAELLVFGGGRKRLRDAVVVHSEVSFVPLYRDQPTFGDVDQDLRSMAFIPHALVDLKRWPLAPVIYDGEFRKPMHQLLEADLVYVRDLMGSDEMTNEQLAQLAMLSHCVYGSSDLAHRAISVMSQRNIVPSDAAARYLASAHPN